MVKRMYKQTEIIEDFEEYIKNDDIRIIKLSTDLSNPKRPMKDIYEYIDLKDLEFFDGNIGISFKKKDEIDQTKPFLIAIDIDGDTQKIDEELKPQLKEQTRLLLYNVLKDGLEKRGYKGLYVKTPTNGYHIYLWTTSASFTQHGFNNFLYPDGMAFQTEYYKNLSNQMDLNFIPVLYKERMSNKSIEIFSQSTMIVAPGSVINDKKYEVLKDGAQKFADISIIKDQKVEDLIFEILEDSHFVRKSISFNDNIIDKPVDNFHNLNENNIKNIGNLILEYWPEIDGEKQEASLALGGFLNSQGVSQESIIAIGEYVLDHQTTKLFKGSDDYERTSGFIPSLLHDSQQQTSDKRTGLTSLGEKFFEKKDISRFKKILWMNTAKTHTFYPDGRDAEQYSKIVLDFEKNRTSYYDVAVRKNKDGDQYPINKSSQKIASVISNISYINDISGKKEFDNELKPIQITIKDGNDDIRRLICKNSQEFLIKYETLPHCHIRKAKTIGAYILREYEDLFLIDTIDSSSRPGIYTNSQQNGLRKFIDLGSNLEEIEPKLPNKEDVTNALILLEAIRDAYPWHDDKFALIVKLGMILPYGYVYKTINGGFIPGIILSGEAGTLKSSVGELILSLSLDLEELYRKEDYIMGGSEVASEFRFGRAFDRTSYPIVINECEDTFSRRENVELVKNAISGDLIRQPGGDTSYYSIAVPILTVNNKPNSMNLSDFSRRFLSIDFVGSERGDTTEVMERLSFLNVNGKINYRFRELRFIGDFIYWTLDSHMEIFSKQPEEISDFIIQELQAYTGQNLNWLLNAKFKNKNEEKRIDETEEEYSMCCALLYDYIAQHIGSNNKYLINPNAMIPTTIKNGIRLGDPFITSIDSQNGVLIKARSFKQEFSKKYYDYDKKISLTQFADIINQSDVFEEKKNARMQRQINSKNVRGLFLTWEELFNLLNIEYEEEDDEDET